MAAKQVDFCREVSMVNVVTRSSRYSVNPLNGGTRVAISLLAFISIIAGPVSGQTIVIDTPNPADAGVVRPGTVITKEFGVKNSGSTSLRLAEVTPACGCMRAKFDRTVAPGGTGKIVLTLDTTGFRGAIVKNAVVQSNDAVTPKIVLVVTANVQGLVKAEPSDSLRIQKEQGTLSAAELVLVSEHPDFKPSSATTTEPQLRVVLRPEAQPNRWKVRVFSDSKAPAGPIAGTVAVKTGIAEEPEFRISVSGLVRIAGTDAAGSTAGAKPGITNDDVVKLVETGLGDEIVIAKVKHAAAARLDVSTEALLALKEKKISSAVIAAMIERAAQTDKTIASAPAPPSSAPPKSAGPCEGVELLGLHKEDFRPVSPLILYFAKVRNGTSMTKIVSVEWTNLYGERIRNTAEVSAGQIATLQLAAQQVIERMPIDLRLGACR